MRESFDDNKLYDEDAQGFGPFAIRNYREVLQGYDYTRYEHRFRALANSNKLAPRQRPKLDENQFATLTKELAHQLLTPSESESDPLSNETAQKAAQRLLLFEDLDEDEDSR